MGRLKLDSGLVETLARELTGATNLGSSGLALLERNVEKRVRETRSADVQEYLELADRNAAEFSSLISSLTIHTTSWFRESPHFDLLKKQAELHCAQNPSTPFRVWTGACSTGEEPYSIGLVLMSIQAQFPNFSFEVYASDIDPVSLQFAQRAIYPMSSFNAIPEPHRTHCLIGQNSVAGFFTIDRFIRQHTHIFHGNLSDKITFPNKTGNEKLFKFDALFCRNVLIYFEKEVQTRILKNIFPHLDSGGVLYLGHSDSFQEFDGLKLLENATYTRGLQPTRKASPQLQIVKKPKEHKALIIEDSLTVRRVLRKILEPSFDIVEADTASEADRILQSQSVQFITLDLNLPGENGVSWLQRVRKSGLKTPVAVVSESSPADAEKVFGALDQGGAQEYVVKSQLKKNPRSLLGLAESLCGKKSTVHPEAVRELAPFKRKNLNPKVILVGASTGGPDALTRLLKEFPQPCPPVVIVQHIGHEFAETFANRMQRASGLRMGDNSDSAELKTGHIYISTGDYHIGIDRKASGQLCIRRNFADAVNGHRPSVSKLFKTASQHPVDSIGILLTGMGKDGADGLLDLYRSDRCFTIVQDEASSVVFGMPRVAHELGAACFMGDISQIRREVELKIRLT